MQLIPRSEDIGAHIEALLQYRQGTFLGSFIALSLPNRLFQLLCQQSTNRGILLCCEDPSLADQIAIKFQGNIRFHSTILVQHDYTCATCPGAIGPVLPDFALSG